jgi:Pyruvate/2-oxoacid:ferredoxin oxidoreductase delta subunit
VIDITNAKNLKVGEAAMVEQVRESSSVDINAELCKGCELCAAECPKNVLAMSTDLNHMGYTFAQYSGQGCSGCSICFYACPEPGTITVHKK